MRRTALLAACLLLVAAGATRAQDGTAAHAGPIYKCVDDHGRPIVRDRPIAECASKEQLILNKDGSARGKVPPTLTADEQAEQDKRTQETAAAQRAQAEALTRDRTLLGRYPNEARHQAARAAALDSVRQSIKTIEQRLRELAQERKPLLDEAEFYQHKTLPPRLKGAIDANDAARDAQRTAAANQEAELSRITRMYDAELDRLRRLWAGAAPGSLGPLPEATLSSRPAPKPAAAASRAR